MPQAIGIAVTGFFGLSVGSITAGIVGGAILGAAIGGISAAVMGGDIGKGLLFGAVGGAVLGGVSGWLNPAEITTTVTNATTAGGDSLLTKGATTAWQSTAVGGADKAGGFLAGLSGEAQAAGITTLGQTLAGAFDTTKEDELALAEKKMETEAQLAREQMKSAEKIAGMRGGGGGGGGADHSLEIANLQRQTALDQLAEERRQYESEVQRAEAARNRQQYAVANVRATGEPTAEQEAAAKQQASIDQQVYQNDSLMYDQNGVLRKPEYA